ncbi:MAG: hypothetical protein ACR2KW_03855 [Rubrobacter sp.]
MPESSTATRPKKKSSENRVYQEGWRDGRFDTDLFKDDDPDEDRTDLRSFAAAYRRGYHDGLRVREMLYAELLEDHRNNLE